MLTLSAAQQPAYPAGNRKAVIVRSMPPNNCAIVSCGKRIVERSSSEKRRKYNILGLISPPKGAPQ
jgi:hypothetical protein